METRTHSEVFTGRLATKLGSETVTRLIDVLESDTFVAMKAEILKDIYVMNTNGGHREIAISWCPSAYVLLNVHDAEQF